MKSSAYSLVNQILESNRKQEFPQPEIISRQGDLVLYKAVDARMIQLLSRGITAKNENQSNWRTCNLGFAYEYAERSPVYFVYKNDKPYVMVSFVFREMENIHSNFPSPEIIREICPLFSNRQEFPLEIINRIPGLLEFPQPEIISRQGDLVLYRTTNALTINRLSRGIFSEHGNQSYWPTCEMHYAFIYAKNDPVYFVYKKDKPYVFVSFARKEIKDLYASLPSLKIVREIHPLFSNRQKFPLEIMNRILELSEYFEPEIISRQGDLVLYKVVNAITIRWLSRGIFCRYTNQSNWRTCQLEYASKYARKGPVYFVYKDDKPYVLVSFACKKIESIYRDFPSLKIVREIRPLFSDRQKFPLEIINRIPELLENFQLKSPRPEIVNRQGDLVLYKVTNAEAVRRLSQGIFSKYKVKVSWCTRNYASARSYVAKGPVYFVYKNNKPYVIISFAAKEMENIYSNFPSTKTIQEIRPLFSDRQEFPLEIMNRIPKLIGK